MNKDKETNKEPQVETPPAKNLHAAPENHQKAYQVGQVGGVGAKGPRLPKEEKKFGVPQFIKLIVIELLFIMGAFFLGSCLKFVFSTPFFFISFGSDSVPRMVMFFVSLLVFLVATGLTLVASHKSFVEFIPGWLLGTIGFFVGVGQYNLTGALLAGGMLIALVVFYFFVQSDIQNSFSFSTRHAFSSLSIFLTLLFAVFSAGYYFAVADVLSVDDQLSDAVVEPAYNVQKAVLARQFDVPEDQVEEKLQELEAQGESIDSIGFFETDGEVDTTDLYGWFKEKMSEMVMPWIRWVAIGLAVSLFLSITVFITPLNFLVRGLLWLVVEGLVAVGVFKKETEQREAIIVTI